MTSNSGALSFDAIINDSQFMSRLDAMERRILGLSTTAVRETGKIDDSFKNLGKIAVGAFAFAGLSDLPQQLIRTRSEVQALEVAYTVLLGSKSKADAFLKQGIEFAAKTPFELDEIAKAQKLMLAYGFSVQSIIPTLTTLGDIAAGTGSNLLELVAAYGQIKTQGIAQQDDLNKLIERGINLTPELSRLLKIAEGDVRQFVSQGKVDFKSIEQAITSLVDGTGKLNFGGLMAEQAKSLTGLTSNLADAWKGMLNQIGKDNQDLLVSIISGATDIVESYDQILGPLKILIATYGTYKSAVILTSVVQAAANVAGNVQAWLSLASTIRSAKDAQIAFNLATSASPWVIAATAIVAITTALIVYKKELTATQQIEQDLREAREKANTQANTEKAKIELLKTTINNEKLSRDARNKALQDLIALSPEHLSALNLDNIKTKEGTRSINEHIEALKRKYQQQELDRKFTESFQRESEAQAGKNEIGFFDKASLLLAQSGSEGTFDSAKAIAEQNKKLNIERIKQEQQYREQLKLEQKALDETASSVVQTEVTKQKVRAVTIKQLDEEISKLRDSKSLDNSDAKNAQIQRDIEKLEQQKRRLTGEKTPEEKKAEKTGPFGSLSYYEAVSKHYDELIAKTPKSDSAKLNDLNNKKLAADQQAEEIRKSLAVKSFEAEIEEKQKLYAQYTKWTEAYGQQAADAQFETLLKSGKSYLDYLNTQITNLENERDNAGLTPNQANNLSSLNDERDRVKGKKTAIEAFDEYLQKSQRDAKSLSDYLVLLKQKQDALTEKGGKSQSDLDIRKKLAEEIVRTEQQLKEQLDQFLISFNGSEEQKLSIAAKYNDLRLALDKKYANNRFQEYKEGLDNINEAERQEFEDFQQRQFEQTEEYKNTTKVILEEGRKREKEEIERQQKAVARAEKDYGTSSEIYKRAKQKLNELVKGSSGDFASLIGQYATVIGQFGQALSQLGGTAGAVGGLISGLASNFGLLSQALKKGVTDGQKAQIAVEATVNIINSITSAAAQRKQAEAQYDQQRLAAQQQYNQLLVEQLGLESQKKENVFTKDYMGRIQDGFAMLNAAEKKYQESLKKLSEGQAKLGQRDAIDWGAVGSSAASGAAIGSIIPGIGTVIGAVGGAIVGGLVGLFGGKKKEDVFGSLLSEYPELITSAGEINKALASTLIATDQVDEKTKLLLQDTIDWQSQIEAAREQIKGVISDLASGLGDKLRDSLVGAFEDGTDSAKAFSASVSQILEDLVTKMLFSKAFNGMFQQLQDDLTQSLDLSNGGDGNTIDDFQRFTEGSKESLALFNQWLAQFQDAAKASGFDVLKPSSASASQATAGSNAVKGIQEETASLIFGQMNAMRLQQAGTNQLISQQLLALGRIDVNTARIERSNELLDKINGTITGLNDGLRAKGIL